MNKLALSILLSIFIWYPTCSWAAKPCEGEKQIYQTERQKTETKFNELSLKEKKKVNIPTSEKMTWLKMQKSTLLKEKAYNTCLLQNEKNPKGKQVYQSMLNSADKLLKTTDSHIKNCTLKPNDCLK